MNAFDITVSLYPFFPIILFTLIGALIGSFLNVVIYRLPHNLSLVKPGSRCGYCEKPIPFYLNIPVFGWLLLRGKTACCSKPYSFRYPMVEALTAGLFVTCWLLTKSLPLTLLYSSFCSLMVAAFFTDLDTMTIPDGLTLGPVTLFAVAGYAVFFFYQGTGPHLYSSTLGLLMGSGSLLWLGMIVSWILNKEAIGLGDIKLMGLVGLVLGVKFVLLAILLGAIISLVLLVLKIKPKALNSPDANPGEFPFGPGLCIASITLLFAALYTGAPLPISDLFAALSL